MTSDARQKKRELSYTITYNVIWATKKTETFLYHWLRALAMFNVTSFPAILLASDVMSSSVDTLIASLPHSCVDYSLTLRSYCKSN